MREIAGELEVIHDFARMTVDTEADDAAERVLS